MNSTPINLHKMWMVFIPFISCLKSNSIAWSPRTFLAPCRQTRFFLANMSTWTWPFVSETKGQPLFSILSQKLHQLLRPVSVEISWPCYQCIHILEIVQKSFIPMKLSTPIKLLSSLSISIRCPINLFNVHKTLIKPH